MSETTRPISPTVFAAALTQLPPSALHGKAAEIRNSLGHLARSNDELEPFAKDGDKDCVEAIVENILVIERMQARLAMLRKEIEGRGLVWGEMPKDGHEEEEKEKNGEGDEVDGEVERPAAERRRDVGDEEMRRRLAEMMQEGAEGRLDEDGGLDL